MNSPVQCTVSSVHTVVNHGEYFPLLITVLNNNPCFGWTCDIVLRFSFALSYKSNLKVLNEFVFIVTLSLK